MKNVVKLIASVFYLGYIPLTPGTIASAAGLVVYLLLRANFFCYTLVLIAVTGLGFLVCGAAERTFQKKDAEPIVIDEVAGLLLAFWGLGLDTTLMLVGFFIFRALDAVKAYPANRVEKISGSLGIMGDDLIAGAYTNIVLRIAAGILSFWL